MELNSSRFRWKAGQGYATVGELGLTGAPLFPTGFDLVSARTGAVTRMVEDQHVMEMNEFFDGEGCAYCSLDDARIKVQIWH